MNKIQYLDSNNITKCHNFNTQNGNKPKYKVRIYNDNRMTITLHDFIPFKDREFKQPVPKANTNKLANKFMSYKDYVRLLKSYHKKLWDRDFDESKCIFITLTLKEDLDYQKLNKQFHRFLVYLKRRYGKVEYVRAIEIQKKTQKLHIHSIIQFNDFPKPINKKIIEDLWKLGICHYRRTKDIRSGIQYITRFKDPHFNKDNPHLTCFLKGTKVITSSQNFGTKINKNSYEETYITPEHLKYIIDYHNDLYRKNKGKFVRIDQHVFYNKKITDLDFCKDRVFIRTTKEFIDNNF